MTLSPAEFIEISPTSIPWSKLHDLWHAQCDQLGEDFSQYGIATLPVLSSLANSPESNAGVFATRYDDEIACVCQLNCTLLPGSSGPVLRMRHLTVSPRYDFGDTSEYGAMLVDTMVGIISLARRGKFRANELKLHLRSPNDRMFFTALGRGLSESDQFRDVEIRGSWLHIILE